MMVSCPGCNNKYLVDERKVPAKGAGFTCRECGKKWRVSVPVEQPPDPAVVPELPDSPPVAASASSGKPAPRPGDSSASLQKPVNCPKCGHHFVPYASHPQPGKPVAPRREEQPRGKVLLVEDQNYFAELTREALGEDFETTVTTNLAAARSLIATGGFDLVILDLSLEGGQDGTQILHATQQLGIPVLIFTARDETDLYGGVWEQLKSAGATDILIKGMNVGDELRQKVRALLVASRKQT